MDSDGTTRSVSPAVAAALASGMPKYNPPTPTPVVNEPKDLRDIDKPRNGIPRLPSYVVRDARPVIFKDRDFYTKDAIVSLSYKIHPGLILGDFLGLNAGPAYEMYMDEQRQVEMADLTDTANAIGRGGDKSESQYILQEAQDTYMRPAGDFSVGRPGGGAKSTQDWTEGGPGGGAK